MSNIDTFNSIRSMILNKHTAHYSNSRGIIYIKKLQKNYFAELISERVGVKTKNTILIKEGNCIYNGTDVLGKVVDVLGEFENNNYFNATVSSNIRQWFDFMMGV